MGINLCGSVNAVHIDVGYRTPTKLHVSTHVSLRLISTFSFGVFLIIQIPVPHIPQKAGLICYRESKFWQLQVDYLL